MPGISPIAAAAMRLALIPLILAATVVHAAEWGQFEYDFEENTKPWQEIQARLPAYPRPDDLVGVEVGAASRNRHYVDLASLSVGEDGVVRYTVVVQSPLGARNVSFEGMRCATGERKLYAFGRPDGGWSKNRHARWEPIQARLEGGYHRELFFHYLCTVDTAGSLDRIRAALKAGGVRYGGD